MSIASGDNREAAALAAELTSNSQEPTQSGNQSVPIHVVQAMREELKQLKEKNEAFSNHMQMMQWKNQSPQPQPQPHNPFQGRDPKDSILVEDAQRMFGDFAHQIKSEIRSELSEVKVASRSSDYKDVINKYLPKAAQEDPEIIDDIKNSANPYKTAYLYAKASKAYQDDLVSSRAPQSKQTETPKSASKDVERIVHNAKQSGSLASVSNLAGVGDDNTKYSRMSDAEFKAMKSSLKFKAAR